MADTATSQPASAPETTPDQAQEAASSAPKGSAKKKKPQYESPLDTPTFIMTVGIAIFGDILSLIPLVGDLFLLGLRLEFFLMGINSFSTNGGMVAGAIIEAIPGISALPACTAFVVLVFFEEKAKENSPEIAEVANKMQSVSKPGADVKK